MWDLVTRLLWLPFDIMQRISQRAYHFGRTIYSGIFASSKPAIKKPPSPPTSPTKLSSPPFQSASSSPIPSCVIIDMEPSVVTPKDQSPPVISSFSTVSSSLNAMPSATSWSSSDAENAQKQADDLGPISDEMLTRIRSDVTTRTGGASASAAQAELPANTDHPLDIVDYAQAKSENIDAAVRVVTEENSVDAAPVKRNQRFREKEKRRQVMSKQDNNFDENESGIFLNDRETTGRAHKLAKKPKLCVDSEDPSTSSCQDAANATAGRGDAAAERLKRNKKRRSRKKKKFEVLGDGLGGGERSTSESQGQQLLGGDRMGFSGGNGGARPPPPNHFIAVQISNKEIIGRIAALQKALTERELSPPWHGLKNTDIFKDAMVPVQKLHFTLHVMHLKGEEDLQKAQGALVECCSKVHQEYVDNPMDLTIEGLGHFRNNVIFAQIKETSNIARLTKLSEIFREKFNELNIPVDPRPFKPHMTIAKISRSNKLYKKKIRSFPPDIWNGLEDTCFGVQRVVGVQLLQMAGEDKLTGYYQCHGQHFFEDSLLIKTIPANTAQTTEGTGTVTGTEIIGNKVGVIDSTPLNIHEQLLKEEK